MPSSTTTKGRSGDPAESYARKIVAGEIVAGRLVRLACKRHLDDLEHGAASGLIWRPDRAWCAIAFFAFHCHAKGE